MIGAQRVDGDEQDVQILRHRRRNGGERRARRRRRARLVAVAVLIDAVVGQVEGAGMDVAIEVVAVAAAEHRRVAVVIEIGRGLHELHERAGGAGEGDRRFAHAIGAADAERDEQQQRRHGDGDERAQPERAAAQRRAEIGREQHDDGQERHGDGAERAQIELAHQLPFGDQDDRDRQRQRGGDRTSAPRGVVSVRSRSGRRRPMAWATATQTARITGVQSATFSALNAGGMRG